MPPIIRSAQVTDIPAIVDIYNEAGVSTTASYDIEPVDLAERTAWYDRLTQAGFPVLVAEDGEAGGVLGYASYGKFRDKAAYAHTVEHSVYVARDARAVGLGRMLMTALIDRARAEGVHVMVGVLDAENAQSLRFHQRLGFVECGRLPEVGRKFDRWLDVVFVTLTFSGPGPRH